VARIEVGDEDEDGRLKGRWVVLLGDGDDSHGGGGALWTTAPTVNGVFFWLAGVGGEG